MNKTPEIRLTGLDLIRSCAILFVIAGHFSLNTGFQQAIFEGPSMFIQGTMKFFFGMGVPLFLLLKRSFLPGITGEDSGLQHLICYFPSLRFYFANMHWGQNTPGWNGGTKSSPFPPFRTDGTLRCGSASFY